MPIILIVEDEAAILKLYTRFFQTAGFEVHAAATAGEAKMFYTSQRPDLAIVDYHLPDENGISLMREMRVEAPDLPMILISGVPTVEMFVEASEIGASPLPKVSGPNELVKTARSMLQRTRR